MAISPEEVGALMGTVFAGSAILILVRAFARKIENQSKQPKLPAESAERMERMERAIDAVAVEVERISENQRFVTKLLADRDESRGLPRESGGREP